jgi:hypothetical protein
MNEIYGSLTEEHRIGYSFPKTEGGICEYVFQEAWIEQREEKLAENYLDLNFLDFFLMELP